MVDFPWSICATMEKFLISEVSAFLVIEEIIAEVRASYGRNLPMPTPSYLPRALRRANSKTAAACGPRSNDTSPTVPDELPPLGIGTVLVRSRLGIRSEENDKYDPAHKRNEIEQDKPTRLASIVKATKLYGETRNQDRESPDARQEAKDHPKSRSTVTATQQAS